MDVTLCWPDPEDAARFLTLRSDLRDFDWLPDPSRDELLRLIGVSEVKDSDEEGNDGA